MTDAQVAQIKELRMQGEGYRAIGVVEAAPGGGADKTHSHRGV